METGWEIVVEYPGANTVFAENYAVQHQCNNDLQYLVMERYIHARFMLCLPSSAC